MIAPRNVLSLIHAVSGGISRELDKRLIELKRQRSEIELPPGHGEVTESELDEALAMACRLASPSYAVGRVLAIHDYRVGEEVVQMARIALSGQVISTIVPVGLTLELTDVVHLNQKQQVVGKAEQVIAGPVARVRLAEDGLVVVDVENQTREVHVGRESELATGDYVTLDETRTLVIRKHRSHGEQQSAHRPLNSLDDVVGQDDAVRIVREAIERHPEHDEITKFYKRAPTRGVLVFGPTGCGKSMLGEGAAELISRVYPIESHPSAYIYVGGPEFLDKYVGETERAIRESFARAERHHKKYGYRAVMVFDEGEAMFSRRGSGRSADMEKTVVPTFLSLMNSTSAFVMLMTNRVDMLDQAVIRDGRFDRQVFVGRPTMEGAEIIVAKNLAKFPIASGFTAGEMAKKIIGLFYAEDHRLLDEGLTLKDGSTAHFALRHIVNGAMLARLVRDAAQLAEEEDRKAGKKSGVGFAHLEQALAVLYAEKKRMPHQEEFSEFYQGIRSLVLGDGLRQTMGA